MLLHFRFGMFKQQASYVLLEMVYISPYSHNKLHISERVLNIQLKMTALKKIFYKGKENDFIIFVEDADLINKFKKGDTTIPLIELVSIYKVFVNRQRGAEGVFDEASKLELSNDFGTVDIDDVIKTIIKEGTEKSNPSLAKGLDGATGANDGH